MSEDRFSPPVHESAKIALSPLDHLMPMTNDLDFGAEVLYMTLKGNFYETFGRIERMDCETLNIYYRHLQDRMLASMSDRLRMAQSTYIEAIQIAESKLPSWDDNRFNAMFSLARIYHQILRKFSKLKIANCISTQTYIL